MLYIVIAILIFGFLIFIHELGHFLTAKLFGVRVNEFAINMGPKLFGWKRGETQYSFRLIPIGGYCSMEGEDGDSEDPRSFAAAAWWKRLIILCAGAFMNLLTGFLIIVLLFGLAGFPMRKAGIVAIDERSALYEQGLRAGDEFYSIGGKRLYQSQDFFLLDGRYNQVDTEVVILRDGKKVTYPHFKMEKREFEGEDGAMVMRYGFSIGGDVEPTFASVNRFAAESCIDFARSVFYGLEDLISGRAKSEDVGGAVRIVDIMVESGKESPSVGDGILNALYIGALIAVNLAVMNMLPIPALDGGRVFFLLIGTVYTAITKKKINPKIEGWINGVALILLLLLMGLLIIHDVRIIAAK